MAHREKKKAKTIFSFFKPRDETSKSGTPSPSPVVQSPPCIHAPSPSNVDTSISNNQPPVIQEIEFDASSLERDPGLRTPLMQEHINQRDMIRRAYIKMGPYQPKPIDREYPRSKFGDQYRRFQYAWFQQFPWLEYSPSKDAAFCFPCFLFEKKLSNCPTLALEGFKNWKTVNDGKRCVFLLHVGGPNSPHNKAVKSVEDLMNVVGHIDKVLNAQTLEEIKKNRLRLTATIKSIRWLTAQACALRGHDEFTDSRNRGNFLEMVKLMGDLDLNIHEVVLDKAPKNATYTSPMIQKEILHICGKMLRNKIREELGDGKYCILVDEAKDASKKEQMAIVLRYVDVHGFIRERFFEIVHVADTTASTLKQKICDVLACNNIDIQNMRGQGYDGASNMRGAWNGLQALFLRDCPYAYYVHCFAHRLQLALVGAAQDEPSVWLFFSKLSVIVNLVNASPKRLAELQSAQAIEIAKEIDNNERVTGRGANQIGSLQRAGKTRWSSHFNSICSLIDMFGASMKVLQEINDNADVRGQASGALIAMRSFEFIFILHMLQKMMEITDLLCRALQQKSLDILRAMELVSSTKELFLALREHGFDPLLNNVTLMCTKYGIGIPDMGSRFMDGTGRSCQQKDDITIEHHYHFDVFNVVIDIQLAELNVRFTDETVELLVLSSALEPKDGFKSFRIDRICTLAEKFYPDDFTTQEMHYLRSQLAHNELDVIRDPEFQNLSTVSELWQRLIESNKSQNYHLIERLIRLVLTLPVSTATTERAFSAMKNVKTELRNKMEDEYLADSMVLYIERELAESIETDAVIDDFYSLKDRRAQLT